MSWKDAIIDYAIRYGFQIIGAVVILGIAAVLAMWVGRLIDVTLTRRQMHAPMRMLIVRICRLCIIAFAAVLALDKFGVQIAPLIAGISVVGIGISLAAQGVLGNAVAGVTIIFSKPFMVDDYVEIAGVDGQVASIQLFSTILLRQDLSRVLIPNRKIVGEIVHNFGAKRQLDLSVGVAYASDLNLVLAVLRRILQGNPRVLSDPAPAIGITALADSSINLAVKPWVLSADCGLARTEIYQAILDEFSNAGIEIPFPQHEVRLLGQQAGP